MNEKTVRNNRIRRDKAKGKTWKYLIDKYDLSYSALYRIVTKIPLAK